tara:strand:- start:2480 stop:2905 length:426 start_codon:yes stop_codon:yes gene_type:complete
MKKVLIINANYYNFVTSKLVNTAKVELKKNKISVSLMTVPGVFEIPIAIKKNINKFDAFVAIGCVIKGKTPHFDLITRSSFDAILKLSILYNKPIGNGIITAFNLRQAHDRSGITKSTKGNKGLEAVKAVLSILKNGPKKI